MSAKFAHSWKFMFCLLICCRETHLLENLKLISN